MKRIWNWKYITLAIFAIYLLTICYIWLILDVDSCDCQGGSPKRPLNEISFNLRDFKENGVGKNYTKASPKPMKKLSKLVTVIIREFELFENDIIDTIRSLLKLDKYIHILVISDKSPYPPLHLQLAKDFPSSRITTIALHSYPYQPINDSQPELFIHTDYVLFIPDSARIQASNIRQMINEHITRPDDLMAMFANEKNVKCLSSRINLREWVLQNNRVSIKNRCDILEGFHVLLMSSKLLMKLNHPFSRPFPYSLYLQTSFKNMKIYAVLNSSLKQEKQLFLDPHNNWKHETFVLQRLINLHKSWGIKKVIHEDGKTDWYGCTKSTTRCFGTVIDDMPDYLYEGRWTPPCCLENLRETARHVFKILEKCGVRYWLEGGSLLGAARSGDIIPWDYDVDIGIYEEDIKKCEWLKNSEKQSIIDNKGFVWEKAREGDFIRVQFSQTNHLHVDIFPFYPSKGMMTKHTWFATHKQDIEFPEHYLKPLTKVKFIGTYASAPNNIRQFLEMKFGKGVIENPEYPNPQKLKFPSKNP
ncbi:fukutin-related protein-like [Centruroides sculpturatus]|uniref:fukutin-related protein-like n=1 Tax=Centruroides sculpturatus TaxID=218467 RepID=UPI000C6CC3C0|nr:fukutin-related protein-like [Centruroides sculpturatus]